jgi:flagellar hook-length control protein FliK
LIPGVNQDFFTRDPGRISQTPSFDRKSDKSAMFAKELSAQGKGKEAGRTDRMDMPGRESRADLRSDANRGGLRSAERDRTSEKKPEKNKDQKSVEMSGAVDSPLAAKSADKMPEPAQKTVDLLESMQKEQAQTRIQALVDFMTGMEQELGVQPERIVDAFSQLADESLLASPQDVADEFVANLGLPPSQEARAAELYQEMVGATQDAMMSEKLAGLGEGVNFRVTSSREESLSRLNQALDQMNQNFFVSSAPVKLTAEDMEAKLAQLVQAGQLEKGLADAGAGSDDSEGLFMKGSALSGLGAMGSAASSENAGAFMESSGGNGSSSGGNESFDSSSLHAEASLEPGSLTTEFSSVIQNAAPGGGPQAAVGPEAMMMVRPQATEQDEQANLRELMRQAQVVLRKGGGEMQMELRPEGMGQVKLKVSVDDGQVNVSMLTESDAAKRLLEKGLNELKANLAAHQLKVDTLRVEVGSEIQKQMDQNQEFSREQARQFAGDFMGQFREERQAFRQGMMESSGLRSYSRKFDRPGMESEAMARSMASMKSTSGSRRLDLVA